MAISAKDLRYRTSEILDRVSRGERILVLKRGKPKAVLVPIESPGEGSKEEISPAFGLWKNHPALKSPRGWLRRLRSGRHPSSSTRTS
ncbi:MAG: type II toxin-antitoxin system prevent-host-death family antitoxin [Nitrospirae bacterium]|nr:type II toxin-antitoxin system prevent-host-death family antitoxin [Nitrospirota bacterium]